MAFDSLRARIGRLEVDRDRAIELEVLRAYTFGDHPARVAAIRDAATIAHGARDVVQYAIAFSPTLADVGDLFGILLNGNTLLSRDDGLMLTRASVEMARGARRALSATLDSTRLINAQHTLEYRAVFATVPGAAATAAERAQIADELRRSTPTARSSVMRVYLLGLLAVLGGDSAAALRYATQLDTMHATGRGDSVYAARTARLVRAGMFRVSRDPNRALAVARGAGVDSRPHTAARLELPGRA